MEKIPLFQGIELYLFSGKNEAIPPLCPERERMLAVQYCHSGNADWQTEDGKRIALNAGDFFLHAPDCAASLCAASINYSGLALYIDLRELSADPPEIRAGIGLDVDTLLEKYCETGRISFFSGNSQTDTIFSAFFGQPERQRLAYQKIKALELILYLSKVESAPAGQPTEYPSDQVEMIRLIHDRLTQNISQRTTIESLSRQYLINPTTLKAVFKSVYGASIAAHIKEHRMEQAAKLLLETELSIAEIGQQIGYESQSKFTSAFKAYYHALPTEYRKSRRIQP